MAQQLKGIPQYTFSQLVEVVEELRKVSEQLNDSSKNLELRVMILEGKEPPLAGPALSQGSISYSDEEVDSGRVHAQLPASVIPPEPELPMSTSERAIQKEAEKIAQIQKAKEIGKEQHEERLKLRKLSAPVLTSINNESKVERQKLKENKNKTSNGKMKIKSEPNEDSPENKKKTPASNGKMKIKSEPKEDSTESLSSSSSSSSSSIDLDDLLNVQKDLLHIETDETWDMPKIQSVTSVKQEAPPETPEAEEPEVSLQRVKVEPGLSDAVMRIEEEIQAQAKARENVRTTPDLELDHATGKIKKVPNNKPTNISEKKQFKQKKEQPTLKKPVIVRKLMVEEESNEPSKTKRAGQPTAAESTISNSKRTRRSIVPLKFEQFEMKKERVEEWGDDIALDKNNSENNDDDDDDDDMDDDDDEADVEEMEGSEKEKVYCKCKSSYNSKQPMIGCDGPCEDWFHFGCVGIPQNFRSIADWYCQTCFYLLTKGSPEVRQ